MLVDGIVAHRLPWQTVPLLRAAISPPSGWIWQTIAILPTDCEGYNPIIEIVGWVRQPSCKVLVLEPMTLGVGTREEAFAWTAPSHAVSVILQRTGHLPLCRSPRLG
eukprot:scaffold53009_cov28-Tisochrysis_lutea.AAC.1